MRDDLADTCVQGDLQDLLVVFQIDTAGRLQPEVVTGAGFRHRFVFVTALQATHWEVFDRAAAEILQQGNGGFHRDDAVRRLAAQRAGGDLDHADGAGRGNQAVHHGLALPQQRTAGGDAGEDLVDVLRLHLAGDFAHHRRLVRIPRAEAHGERIINQCRVFAHIRYGAVHVRVVFREHTHQHMTFCRFIDGAGIGFGSGQHVQANAVAVKIGGQFHAFFSWPNTSLMRR